VQHIVSLIEMRKPEQQGHAQGLGVDADHLNRESQSRPRDCPFTAIMSPAGALCG